jgi:hypothetical protein
MRGLLPLGIDEVAQCRVILLGDFETSKDWDRHSIQDQSKNESCSKENVPEPQTSGDTVLISAAAAS